MIFQKRWFHMFTGALLALALVAGLSSVFAQTGDGDADEGAGDAPAETTPDTAPGTAVSGDGFRVHGRFADRGVGTEALAEALAEALGVTVEALAEAQQEAFAAALGQAVDDGLLTQAQADQILENGRGPRGFHDMGEGDAYLAEALGITVEELAAARAQVHADRLAAMVAEGVITQEQADLMLARQAVQDYVDVTALQEAAQAIYEEAVSQALAEGVISDAQAEQLLESQIAGPRGFGFGGPGRGHGRGPGFGGPRGLMPGFGG